MLQVVQDDDSGVVVGVRRGDRPQELFELGHSVRLDGESDDGLVDGGREVPGSRSRRRGGRRTCSLRVSVAVGEVLGESDGVRANEVVVFIAIRNTFKIFSFSSTRVSRLNLKSK